MAIDAAVNVCAFHANIILAGAPVAPPLSGPEETDNRGARGNCDVGRAGVSADINAGSSGQGIKTFQRKADRSCFAGIG